MLNKQLMLSNEHVTLTGWHLLLANFRFLFSSSHMVLADGQNLLKFQRFS
jgi:hypothetical protein